MIVLMMSGTGWVLLSIRYSGRFRFQVSLWRAILTCAKLYCRPSFLVGTFLVTHSHGLLRVFSDTVVVRVRHPTDFWRGDA